MTAARSPATPASCGFAERHNVVNRLCEPERLDGDVVDLITVLLDKSPRTLRCTKYFVDQALPVGVDVLDRLVELGRQLAVERVVHLVPVTIAAVDGVCTGGGLELTLACDLVIATTRSRWGMPEINWAPTECQ